jgi:hypothetical protein
MCRRRTCACKAPSKILGRNTSVMVAMTSRCLDQDPHRRAAVLTDEAGRWSSPCPGAPPHARGAMSAGSASEDAEALGVTARHEAAPYGRRPPFGICGPGLCAGADDLEHALSPIARGHLSMPAVWRTLRPRSGPRRHQRCL